MENDKALQQFKGLLRKAKNNYSPLTVSGYLTDVSDFLSFVKNEGFGDLLLDIKRDRIFGHYLNHLGSKKI